MGIASNKADFPLKVCKKLTHQSRSSLTALDSFALCETCLSTLIWLKIRRRKTRPPFTTPAAQDNRPARACSWRLDARLRCMKPWSSCLKLCSLSSGSRSTIATESSSIPKNVILVVGSTTLPQCMEKPSLLRSWMRTFKAIWHSIFDWEIIRKSSKYTTTRSNPLRAIILFTACVILWKMPGLNRAPKQSFESRIYTVCPFICHLSPVTCWLRWLRPTDLYALFKSTLAKKQPSVMRAAALSTVEKFCFQSVEQ